MSKIDIREAHPSIPGSERLQRAYSLAMVLSTSDQLEDDAHDLALMLGEELEAAHAELAAKLLVPKAA